MALKVYLGVDVGAESGRVMAGLWNGKTIRLEEIHRFPNGAVSIGATIRWDVLRLWAEIQNGLTLAARRYGKKIVSVGVDTWGVDFVLLNKQDEILGQPYHYRDARTTGMMGRAFARVPREEIFAQSGIQFMELNSLYQLLAWKIHSPEILECAEKLLFMPDFFHWCLCGAKLAEFTVASTSQFVHPLTRDWSLTLLQQLDLPTHFLPKLVQPGTILGTIRKSVSDYIGLSGVKVVAPPAHDTASAVAAIPVNHRDTTNWVFLNSGTWSLMGVEANTPLLSPRTLELNMANEGGVDGTYRLLQNLLGLWIVQQCKRSFAAGGRRYDYPQLMHLASTSKPRGSLIDLKDARLVNPPDMPTAMADYCRETKQPVPKSDGEFIRCAYESLAHQYAGTLKSLDELTDVQREVIHIVGGGAQNQVLNQLTANACQRPVVAGPVEATAMGNILTQVRASRELGSLEELREVVRRSSNLQCFEPQSTRTCRILDSANAARRAGA